MIDLLFLVFIGAALVLNTLGRREMREANAVPGAQPRKNNGKLVASAVMIAIGAVVMLIRGVALLG